MLQRLYQKYVISALVLQIFGLVALLGVLADGLKSSCPNHLVSPFIGTTGLGYGSGQLSPSAQLPRSALRLGPDTTSSVVDLFYRHCSGYSHNDTLVRAFSHTELVGAGIPDFGNFGIMPTTDKLLASECSKKRKAWYSSYDKEKETAGPGYYSTFLNDPGVQVNLLAVGNFAGIHSYQWQSEKTGHKPALVLDFCHGATETISNDPDHCQEAKVVFSEDNRQFNASIQFKGDLSKDIIGMHLHANIIGTTGSKMTRSSCADKMSKGNLCFNSTDAMEVNSATGTLFTRLSMDTFPEAEGKDKHMIVQVALSFIDIDQAVINYNDVFTHARTFSEWKDKVDLIWCEELSRVYFESSDQDLLTQLYTANYRSLLGPTQYSEVGGLYMGLDKRVHNAKSEREDELQAGIASFEFYSDLSLWDTFRTHMPWLLLTRPDVHVGILRSMVEMTSQTGAFPKWPLASVETNCMVGKHGMACFAESVLSGYGKYYKLDAIEPIVFNETASLESEARVNNDFYLKNGYVALEDNNKAASLTLTYAFDDYSAAIIENYAGNVEASNDSKKRSLNYQQIFVNESQLMCPRSLDGTSMCPGGSTWKDSKDFYVEGDAEQWRYFAPHDIEGLKSLFSSPQMFEKTLLDFFSKHVEYDNRFGNAAPNPYFWAGNEVDLLTPFLFNLGNCTYTQYWTREVLNMHFSSNPNGLPGNDDYGTTSAFFLFASLGLYPQAGTSRFFVSSPAVDYARVEINDILSHTDDWMSENVNNKEENNEDITHILEIIVHNGSNDYGVKNVYVSKLLLNSIEINTPFVERELLLPNTANSDQITHTKLEFFMSSEAKSGLCADF